MKCCLLVVSFLFLVWQVPAQNQHTRWCFGMGAGLNFSSGSPVAIGSAIQTNESCASISNASGNLLFYTNGVDVWNANHMVMPNGSGLQGHISAQCVIIPRPGNPGKYYIVATDAIESGMNRMTYSEVDMSLQGGFGDVSGQKNVLLNTLNGEWITVVRHANCVDAWIISHGKNPNNVFLAFHVSASGINPVPVTTNLGIDTPTNLLTIGIMRPNSAGTKIAMSRPYAGSIELIDFDKTTGTATAITNLHSAAITNGNSYGLEFSRSGNKLYSGEFGYTHNSVFQYDMTAANIPATRIQVGQLLSFAGEIGMLQLAPDDKIYVNYNITPHEDFLGVINNPELVGTACGYLENAVSLTGTTIYGLPWYYNPDSFTESPLDLGSDLTICHGTTITLSNESAPAAGGVYLWSDGSTNPTLQVSEPGTYWLSYRIASCVLTTDSIVIQTDTSRISHMVGDTSGCAPFTIELAGIGSPGTSGWTWDMGNGDIIHSQNVTFPYTTPGIYTISLKALSQNSCVIQDSAPITAKVFPLPIARFSVHPLLIEPGVPALFTDQSVGNIASWLWEINGQQVSTGPTCTYTLGDYFQSVTVLLTVTSSDGCRNEKKIQLFKPADLIYIPNTFTPDGNPFNAIFRPVDYFNLVREFTVYNRWGETVWSETSATNGWNGLVNGKPAPEGVYTWVIKLGENGIVSRQLDGHVTLIR